jgi:hypothetical protein
VGSLSPYQPAGDRAGYTLYGPLYRHTNAPLISTLSAWAPRRFQPLVKQAYARSPLTTYEHAHCVNTVPSPRLQHSGIRVHVRLRRSQSYTVLFTRPI